MSYTSREEQLAYLDFVMLHDYDAVPREIRIREAAEDAITNGATYTPQGYRMAILTPRRPQIFSYRENDAIPLPSSADWPVVVDVVVKLIPELQGSLEVARILAENQIRQVWP